MLTLIVARHRPGSAEAVLLSKWLGDSGADLMASMIGSESMTSSDWMLLALSNMGQVSQKKVGEAFVQRLLEKGDIHPAVAILLGLGEYNDAVEVYVSQKHYMEAVLLTSLTFPADWQRQSFLVRKWGEAAVSQGKAELAVRCFSCMGLETTEPWFSPRAQDAVFSAQKQALLGSQLSPPLSPPSVGSSRVAARMASLKLVTDFASGPQPMQILHGDDDEQMPMNTGATPIVGRTPATERHNWLGVRGARDTSREPSSARTATPGAYGRKRMPSRSDTGRSATTNESLATLALPNRGQRGEPHPKTAIDNIGREAETLPFSHRRANSISHNDSAHAPFTLAPAKLEDHLPSPAVGVFESLRQKGSESRTSSRNRNQRDLYLEMNQEIVESGPDTHYTNNLSPPLTGASTKSAKGRSIDQYISSLDEANYFARTRADSRTEERPASRTARTRSRTRDESQNRGRSGVRYIKPGKRSPSSPVPMTPEDAGISVMKSTATNTDFDDERFYKMDIASPVASEPVASTRSGRSRPRYGVSKTRSSSKAAYRTESPEGSMRIRSRGASRASSRRPVDDRGRSAMRGESGGRSPESPQSMRAEDLGVAIEPTSAHPRNRSTSRRPRAASNTRYEQSPERHNQREPSVTRKATPAIRGASRTRVNIRGSSPDSMTSGRLDAPRSRPTTRTKKELAAKELEARRQSLARRPLAPAIPLPGDLAYQPLSGGRSNTDEMLGSMSTMYRDPIQRSQTADPITKPPNRLFAAATSTSSVPIGLPANPRAMRHPRYMSADPNESKIPAVPSIPDNLQNKRETEKAKEDDIGPLLPATTFLPSTTFGQPVSLPRSASAPPQEILLPTAYPGSGRRPSLGSNRSHGRSNTPPEVLDQTSYSQHNPSISRVSIGDRINDSQVVILEEEDVAPPILSQLQHLASPPPPPPPPLNITGTSAAKGVGMINIAIEGSPTEQPQQMSPINLSNAGSPQAHRRGRGSVSENIGSTFRRVTDRMRSTSRSGHISPPNGRSEMTSPYESVSDYSFSRHADARSPGDGGNIDSYFNNIPPPPPPPPVRPWEQVVPPTDDMSQSFYKNPKEIRANMPPDTLQPGVYKPEATPMI